MIKQRLKRGLAWLLVTLLVLGAVAGCGSQAPAASQSQAVTAGAGQESDSSQSQAATASGQGTASADRQNSPAPSGREASSADRQNSPASSGQEASSADRQNSPASSGQEPSSADHQNTGSGSSRQPEAAQTSAPSAGQEERTQEPAFGSAESQKGNHNQKPEKPGDSRNPETAEDADSDLNLDPNLGLDPDTSAITEDGSYTTREEVALYLHTFGHLPGNYITKKEAEQLGWDNKKGNLWEVAPGKSIGGSHFGNYEKQLPEKKGRKYYECDINYEGKYRGAERIIYSDDGLVFYTGDHYKTFEQMYP